MEMQDKRLSPSASKFLLFAALGLELGNPDSETIYSKMMDEACTIRKELETDPECLSPSLRDKDVKIPFHYSQIMETKIHKGVLRMVKEASPESAPYYRRGAFTRGSVEENWVARWYLWRAFHNHRSVPVQARRADGTGKGHDIVPVPGQRFDKTPSMPDPEAVACQPIDAITPPHTATALANNSSNTSGDQPTQSATIAQASEVLYWDPVREIYKKLTPSNIHN